MAKPSIASLTADLVSANERITELEGQLTESLAEEDAPVFDLPLVEGEDPAFTNDAAVAVGAWRERAEAEAAPATGTMEWTLADGSTTNDPAEFVEEAKANLTSMREEFEKAAEEEMEKLKSASGDDDRMSKADQDKMATDLAAMKDQLEGANLRVGQLETRLGSMRMSTGAQMPLTHDQVRKMMETPGASFQVVEEYKFMGMKLQTGRKIRAMHYPQILDYVKNGLRLIEAE